MVSSAPAGGVPRLARSKGRYRLANGKLAAIGTGPLVFDLAGFGAKEILFAIVMMARREEDAHSERTGKTSSRPNCVL